MKKITNWLYYSFMRIFNIIGVFGIMLIAVGICYLALDNIPNEFQFIIGTIFFVATLAAAIFSAFLSIRTDKFLENKFPLLYKQLEF